MGATSDSDNSQWSDGILRFGARALENEKPGAVWDPPQGEIFVQSLYFELGVDDEYGPSENILDNNRVRMAAGIIQELNPTPHGESILPTDDPAKLQYFYRRMRRLAKHSLKAPQRDK
ncbi:hypothetical protein [Mycobacterium sp. SMC-4]|uniref:hypothetical protein n=1 Tax=Mycobacterium sp. SMC-4 TaxID=2857059 RepID=UPI003D00928B